MNWNSSVWSLVRLNRRSENPNQINRLVRSNTSIFMIKSRSYPSNCFKGKRTPNHSLRHKISIVNLNKECTISYIEHMQIEVIYSTESESAALADCLSPMWSSDQEIPTRWLSLYKLSCGVWWEGWSSLLGILGGVLYFIQ